MSKAYTVYFWNSGGEREEHGTHKTLKAARAEKKAMQKEWGDDDSRFEIVVEDEEDYEYDY
jgi:hypothetical protein